MATLIKAHGREQNVTPANGEKFTLEEMQGYVGGYIEIIGLPDGSQLILNEEGKLKGLEPNLKASLLARKAGIHPSDYVVGDVLIASRTEAGFDDDEEE